MQLIIDIPEEMYKNIQIRDWRKDDRKWFSEEWRAIRNGTPLSKGHGDLIERSEAIKINELHHGQMPNHINHQIWNEINNAPTIIEADKELEQPDKCKFFKDADCCYPIEDCDNCPNHKESD